MLGDYELEMPEIAWQKLDIRREGQPISTDEFLEKALSVRLYGLDDNTALALRVSSWITGNFTAAMEGLE